MIEWFPRNENLKNFYAGNSRILWFWTSWMILADWKAIHSMFPPWSYGLPKLCGDSWLPVAASICWLQQSTTFELGTDRFQNIHQRVSWRLRQICWRNHPQSWSAELSWLHRHNLTKRSGGSRLLRVLGVGRWATMNCNKVRKSETCSWTVIHTSSADVLSSSQIACTAETASHLSSTSDAS